MFIKSQKGQSEEAFRLLIAFVIATAILVIIISMISITKKNTHIISNKRLIDEIKSASNTPGVSSKIPYKIDEIKLKGILSKRYISENTGLKEDCFYLKYGIGFEKANDSGDIQTKNNKEIQGPIYIYCDFDGSDIETEFTSYENIEIKDSCDKYCIIYINSTPPKSIYEDE